MQLLDLNKGTQSVDTYLCHAKSIVDALISINKPVPEPSRPADSPTAIALFNHNQTPSTRRDHCPNTGCRTLTSGARRRGDPRLVSRSFVLL